MSVLVTYKGGALKRGNAYMHRQVGSPEPEPIVLPPQTIRFRFENADYDPTVIENGGVWTKVAGSSYNDWDWYCASSNWDWKFSSEYGWPPFTDDNKTSIIAFGDMSNVTSTKYMFSDCDGLISIPEVVFPDLIDGTQMFYDCPGLTKIADNAFPKMITGVSMFGYCENLTSIPANAFPNLKDGTSMFNSCYGLTSIPENAFQNLKDGWGMFDSCLNVQSGALGLYTNLKNGGKVTNHSFTFSDCGKDTETGLAELRQIPQSWGGLAS